LIGHPAFGASQRQRKKIILFSAIFASRAKRAVYFLLTYPHSIAWTIPLQAGRFKGLIKNIKGNKIIMAKDTGKTTGIKSMINKYRKIFRTPENLNHYSDEDYKEAERKFLKFSLFGRNIDSHKRSFDSQKSSNKS